MLKATRSDRPPVAKKEIRKESNNRQRPKNFNSGYFKKYILYVVIFVLLLFLSFIFFAPMFINLKVWKPEIISMLEENTGKSARIKGDIDFKIYPSPQVKVHDISLVDDKSGVINNFIRTDSVIAKLSFLSLIKGKFEIEKIIIDNLTINLLNSSNNKPNWVLEKKIVNKDQINEIINDKYLKFNQVKYPNIIVNEYSITKGNVIYNNTSKMGFENISIKISQNVNILEGGLSINDNKYLLNSTFSKDEEDLWLTKLNIYNNDIEVGANINIAYSKYFPSLEGELDVNYKNIKNLLSNNEFKYLNLLEDRTNFTGGFSLSFNNNDLFYTLFNIDANIGDLSFTGALSGNNGVDPKIELALSSNNVDLDSFIEQVNKINKNHKSDDNKNLDNNDYWDKYSGKFIFSIGTSKLLDYPVRNLSIEINKTKSDYYLNSGKATFPGNTNITFKGLFKNQFSIFEGGGSLESENIRDFYRWLSSDLNNISDTRLKKASINSEVVFRKGGATFAGIKGKIDSSNINGEVRLRFGDVTSAIANLKIDSLNLDSYLDEKKNSEDNNLNKIDLLNFDIINFDLQLENLLLFKNKYSGIIFKNNYKNSIFTIDQLDILDFVGGELNVTGEINYKNKDPIYDISVGLDHKDFSKVHHIFDLPKVLESFIVDEGSLKISSSGSFGKLKSQLQFQNSNSKINYSGMVELNNYIISGFKGNLEISTNNLNDILDISEEGDTKFSSGIEKKNNVLSIENINVNNSNYKYSGNIIINNMENNFFDLDVDIEANTLDFFTLKNMYNYFYLNSDSKFNGDLKIHSDLFNINEYQISDFEFLINLNKDSINLKKADGKLFGGFLSASAKVLYENLYEYNGKIIFKNLKSSEFFNNYFLYDKFNSEISSEFIIKGKANSFNEFFETMEGEGEIQFKKNLLKGLDVTKIININNIQGDDDLMDYVYQSFSSDKEKKLDEFNMNYTFSNNSLTFPAFEIKIDDFFTLIDGQLNLKTKDYFLSTKFFKNNDLDNFLSLNLSRTNNKFFNSADNSTSINNTDINVEDKSEDSEDSSNFDTVLNELSDDTKLIENTEEQLIEKEVNNIDNNLNENGQSSKENIEDNKKTSIPLFFKNISILKVMDYYKPNKITNNLSIPKLPTEEDLLDELLDSVLSPSD